MSRILWIAIQMTGYGTDDVPLEVFAARTDPKGGIIGSCIANVIWEQTALYGSALDYAPENQKAFLELSGVLQAIKQSEKPPSRDDMDVRLCQYVNNMATSDALGGAGLDWDVMPVIEKHFPKFFAAVQPFQLLDLDAFGWICENVNQVLQENIDDALRDDAARIGSYDYPHSRDVVYNNINRYKSYLDNFFIQGDDE